jgi:hypothetical protein
MVDLIEAPQWSKELKAAGIGCRCGDPGKTWILISAGREA